MAEDSSGVGGGPWSESAGHIGAAPPPSWGTEPAEPAAAPPGPATQPGPAPGRAGRTRRSRAAGPFWTPPARRGNPYTAGGPTNGRSSYATAPVGYRYRNGMPVRTGTPRPVLFWVAAVLFSAISLGLVTPVVAVVSWVMFRRARRQGLSGNVAGLPVDRFWKVTAWAWTAIFVLVVVLYAVVGAATDHSSSSDGYRPPTLEQVSLGATASVSDQVGPHQSDKDVPVVVTVTGVDRTTNPGDAAVGFKVCAASKPVDPLAAAYELQLGGPAGTTFQFDDNKQFPDAVYSTLAPNRCVAFPVDFLVPTQDAISTVTFGIDSKVQWPAS